MPGTPRHGRRFGTKSSKNLVTPLHVEGGHPIVIEAATKGSGGLRIDFRTGSIVAISKSSPSWKQTDEVGRNDSFIVEMFLLPISWPGSGDCLNEESSVTSFIKPKHNNKGKNIMTM
jgi:hypothetical protein